MRLDEVCHAVAETNEAENAFRICGIQASRPVWRCKDGVLLELIVVLNNMRQICVRFAANVWQNNVILIFVGLKRIVVLVVYVDVVERELLRLFFKPWQVLVIASDHYAVVGHWSLIYKFSWKITRCEVETIFKTNIVRERPFFNSDIY